MVDEPLKSESIKYLVLPALVVPVADGAILKRGNYELLIRGSGIPKLVHWILRVGLRPRSLDEIVDSCVAELDCLAPQDIRRLLQQLVDSGLAVPAKVESELPPDTPANVYAWNFDRAYPESLSQISKACVTILGHNEVASSLARGLVSSGLRSISRVNVPEFLSSVDPLNVRDMIEGEVPTVSEYTDWLQRSGSVRTDLLVAASVGGGHSSVKYWNEYAVLHGIPFLPVMLYDQRGQIGPLVIPGDTACYECLCAREDSNTLRYALRREAQRALLSDSPAIGYLPAMADVLGALAAIEIWKYFSPLRGASIVGRIVDTDFSSCITASRPVYKVPRCSVCSPRHTVPGSEWEVNSKVNDTWVTHT